jgi:erythromycin esterase
LGGASVALIDTQGLVDHATTSADGSFSLRAPRAGRYSVSAQAREHVGAFVDGVKVAGGASGVDLTLGRAANGVAIAVHVRHSEPLPHGAALLISRLSDAEGDVWFAPIDPATETASAILPSAKEGYRVRAVAPLSGYLEISDAAHVLVLDAAVQHAPTAPVIAYVREQGIRIASTDPKHEDFADLEPLGRQIGDAGVVGVGEATHGTREFFQLKHRLFEYLATRRGFTTFAFEADQAECRRIEAYVQNTVPAGVTAQEVVHALGLPVWRGEEIVDLVAWMHSYNATADARGVPRLHFVGFDMQGWWPARRELVSFLDRVAPEAREPLEAALSKIEIEGSMSSVLPAVHAEIDDALAAAGRVVAAHHSDPDAAAAARDVTSLVQWHAYAIDPSDRTRDRAMADNIVALRAAAPHDKMMVWAHNYHIGRYAEVPSMGIQLANALGADYLSLGFVLGGGTFLACGFANAEQGDMTVTDLADHSFAPASAVDTVAPFVAVGAPLLALDLRSLPKGSAAAAWFSAPHPLREVGFLFNNESQNTIDRVLSAQFDIALFVAQSTSAHTPKANCYE